MASVGGWAWTANRTSRRHAHRASFLALVILIALLFPVVSISDDLHEDQAKITGEEPKYKDDLQHRLECAGQLDGRQRAGRQHQHVRLFSE